MSQWLDLIQWEPIHLRAPKVIQWLIWRLPIRWELIRLLALKEIQWPVLMRLLEELWIKLWTKELVGVPPIQEHHQTRL